MLGRENTFVAVTYKMITDLPNYCQEPVPHSLNNVKLVRFLRSIYSGYRTDVAYHNDLHGVDVAQMMYYMIKSGDLRDIA